MTTRNTRPTIRVAPRNTGPIVAVPILLILVVVILALAWNKPESPVVVSYTMVPQYIRGGESQIVCANVATAATARDVHFTASAGQLFAAHAELDNTYCASLEAPELEHYRWAKVSIWVDGRARKSVDIKLIPAECGINDTVSPTDCGGGSAQSL